MRYSQTQELKMTIYSFSESPTLAGVLVHSLGCHLGVTGATVFSGRLSWGTVVHLRATSLLQENLDFPIVGPKHRFLESKSRNTRPLKGHSQNSVPSAAMLLVKASHRSSPDSGRGETDFPS